MVTASRTGRNERDRTSISTSRYLCGLQCHKLLWHAYNTRHLFPAPDDATQAIFDQGHEVGALAKLTFPDGLEVGYGILDLDETIRLTREAIRLRKPLFEAAFCAEGGYCRVDILRPAPGDAWDIIEVKSTTSVKDVHLDDLAFQNWVLTKAGIKVRACYLCCINSDFVRHEELNPKKFFVLLDVTAQVCQMSRRVAKRLGDMFSTIRQPEPPATRIGPHCDDPYMCALHDQCWSFLPPQNVLDLYRGTKKGFGLLNRGTVLIRDIPPDVDLTANQAVQRATAISGQPHVNRNAISAFLARLQYPVHYLDFETFATAIPMFDGMRPYQQIPFQFSLHIVRTRGAEPEHFSFLAEGRHDPRPEFMHKLHNSIGRTGSIVAFNASFEISRLKECCDPLPSFSAWVADVESRIVDLLDPFRSFNYYHPDQHGSASMKAVLPALTGRGYESLDIQEGGAASREFLRVTFGDVSESERQEVGRQLELYCGQDTEGMVWITNALCRLVQKEDQE